MSHIIIILILTLNVIINQLHASDQERDTYTESPTEPQLIHNGDGVIHLYFPTPHSTHVIRDETLQGAQGQPLQQVSRNHEGQDHTLPHCLDAIEQYLRAVKQDPSLPSQE